MPVRAEADLRLEPTLEEARELAREGNVVPVRARFVEDTETPVSAFLKLRAAEPEGAPCFLLESAEQGQGGRYALVGPRPRGPPPAPGRRPPALQGRALRFFRLSPRALGGAARRAEPRRARPPRHGP